MTTFAQLVDQIAALLHSYTGLQEQVTTLTSPVDSDDLQLLLLDTSGMSRGILEVGDELIYASSVDNSGAVVPAFGRGFRGSTAASHSAGSMVTFDPVFPRVEIKNAINQCLESVFPTLYQIKSTTFTVSGAQSTYELPADCDQVLKVTYLVIGPTQYEATVRSWETDTNSVVASTNTLTLHEAVDPGRTVKVIYAAKFAQFADDSDTFATVGLQESMFDILLYGATSKLIRFLDPSRLQLTSAENLSRATVVAAGDAGKLANQLYAMYQQRLNEERRRLLVLTPPQITYTGV